ncbi:MAG: hypothetical protein HC844_04605 [Tabrizicola sp.]|nr:hypothetical protein [Tabrizicola sp.]
MSTWISRAALFALLAGCLPVGGPPDGGTRAASILGGALTVAAPRDYCIDTGSASRAKTAP